MCYVLGCTNSMTFYVRRQHKVFGEVTSCLEHDPAQHGYQVAECGGEVEPPAAAIGEAGEMPSDAEIVMQLLQTILSIARGNGPEGGSRVPRVPVSPMLPPGGVANPF